MMMHQGAKTLRRGITTGTCAAAAAKAATAFLYSGYPLEAVTIRTPKGIKVSVPVVELRREGTSAVCAVRKDSGDDPDITNGMLVEAKVRRMEGSGEELVVIDGGVGVGRVTKPGLDQPVGAAAINRVPRQMIREAVLEVTGGRDRMEVIIQLPQGEELAAKTFNPRLGIVGGLSVLGTSGIVEPMSEEALVATIRAEMQMRRALGETTLYLVPGNYGEDYAMQVLGLPGERLIKCSNFLGASFDMAVELGFERVLLIGHIGKLVKLGAGVMNTHSRYADGRLEVLCACGVKAGADNALLSEILDCATTDAALALLARAGLLEKAMEELLRRLEYHMRKRLPDEIEMGVYVFSNEYGRLGCTKGIAEFENR